MRLIQTSLLLIAAATFLAAPAGACGPYGGFDLPSLATYATHENQQTADWAIGELRAKGPEGLQALLEKHEALIESGRAAVLNGTDAPDDPAWPRIVRAIDLVGGQRDNLLAPLFWYTDLEQAKAAAASSGRPILSLRMLGRLDEDYSCANSRFFRTAIYANPSLASMLQSSFVLHWQTVRPVPRITIDFGDGREIVRTITGNCAHLVLDDAGRPLDVIPGLYGPQAFERALSTSLSLHAQIAAHPEQREQWLRTHHDRQARQIKIAWARDLLRLGQALPGEVPQPVILPAGHVKVAPEAIVAAPVAVTKMGLEMPVLAAIRHDGAAFEGATGDDVWDKIAALHVADSKLDASSVALMKKKMHGAPTAHMATVITKSKRLIEDPMVRMVRQFESSLARDSVYNEYVLRRAIHEWFAAGAVGDDAQALNDRIYDELFLTPGWDPWLGLVPAGTYAALDHNGFPCR